MLSDNWTENYPISLPLDKVPAKSPYPAPSWTPPPSTLTNLVLPIPQPPIALPIPDRVDNPGQKQQLETSPLPSTVAPTPAPQRQRDEADSGEQPVAQDPAVSNFHTTGTSRNITHNTSPLVYSHPMHHLLSTHLTRNSSTSHSLDVMKHPHRHHPPNLLRSWILTNWVSLPLFLVLRIALIPVRIDEDALNILRAPNPEEEATNEVKGEDTKPTIYLSVKAEIANVKTEDDEARHSGASGSGPRMLFPLDICLCTSPGRVLHRTPTGYQPSQALIEAFNSLRQPEQTPLSARLPTRDPRRQSNAGASSTCHSLRSPLPTDGVFSIRNHTPRKFGISTLSRARSRHKCLPSG